MFDRAMFDHVGMAARDLEPSRAFHTAAPAAGGRDNGAPGLRPRYLADHDAAFGPGPGGHNHNVEAVCHRPL